MSPGRRGAWVFAIAALIGVAGSCGSVEPANQPGPPSSQGSDRIVPATYLAGVDAEDGFVVIATGSGGEADVGGWFVALGDGRLQIPPSVRIAAGTDLRVHSAAGDTTARDLFLGTELSFPVSGLAVLHDAFGGTVDELRYP